MAEDNLIPDDLLRELIGVGHVDLLVGIPTFNHGDTIADVVGAVQASFLTHFPRQRTVLLNSDAGSTDGTPQLVRDCCLDGTGGSTAAHGLRTAHRITTPYQGASGKGSSLRLIFAAADLLQASVVVVLDPDVTNVTPAWVAALAVPVRDRRADFVAPVYQRPSTEGLLVTQLLRPTVRALYGWRLREPLVAEFGCSGRFAAHCTERLAWTTELARDGASCWIACEALAGGFATCQTELGPRDVAPNRPRPPLSDLFQQVVGSTFAALEAHSGYWLRRTGSEDVPTTGRGPDAAVLAAATQDGGRLLQSFEHDVRNLNEILRRLLGAETFAAVEAVSTSVADPRYPDALWASTLAEFVLAFHHGVMRRDHILQALVPLYLARTGSFLQEHGSRGPADVEAAIESLSICLEQIKPRIVERWDNQQEVAHG